MSWEVKADMRGTEAFRQAMAEQLHKPAAAGPIRDCLNEQWPKTYLSAMQDRFDRLSRGGGEWPPLSPSTIAKRRGGHQQQIKSLKLRLGALGEEQQKAAKAKLRAEAKAALSHLNDLHGASESDRETQRRKDWAGAMARQKVFTRFRGQGAAIKTTAVILAAANVSILRDTGTLFRALGMHNPGNVADPIPDGVTLGVGGDAKHEDSTETIGGIARVHQEGLGKVPVRRIIVAPDDSTNDRLVSQLDHAVTETRKAAGA